jgi:stage II sporulation protein D
MKNKLLLSILLSYIFLPCKLAHSLNLPTGQILNAQPSSQVSIRLFTEFSPDYAIFTVISGKYSLSNGSGTSIIAGKEDPLLIARYNSKIYVKQRNHEALLGDSVEIKGLTGSDNFSLKINVSGTSERYYSGDLKCYSDMETLLLLNSCDIEQYLAGVVKAEGGNGKNEEYFRTQAVIARTYTYKYFNKHSIDRYNLCDDTHCQVYYGLISDSLIINAVQHTSGLVITTPDSLLINSAFHSNCGGETSPSEFAWVTSEPYLKKVTDPYCRNSRNALWNKKISLNDWTEIMIKNGYTGILSNPSLFSFNQSTRMPDYVAGSFSMPFRTIRSALSLRSSFFSVSVDGDSLLLKGRGYGHGVGLCQEGAMIMAVKGYTYKQIIDFYYFGVLILDIKNAVFLPPNP